MQIMLPSEVSGYSSECCHGTGFNIRDEKVPAARELETKKNILEKGLRHGKYRFLFQPSKAHQTPRLCTSIASSEGFESIQRLKH